MSVERPSPPAPTSLEKRQTTSTPPERVLPITSFLYFPLGCGFPAALKSPRVTSFASVANSTVASSTAHSVIPSRPQPRTRTTPIAAPRRLHAHKRSSAVGQLRFEHYKRHRSHLTITTESLCRAFYVGVAEGGRPVEARDCLRSPLIPR